MKYLIFTVLFLFIGCAGYVVPSAQEKQLVVVKDCNKTKSEIYALIYQYVAQNFVSANDVIQMADKDNGMIVLKCGAKVTNGAMRVPARFTMSIRIKDNKYQVICDRWTAFYGQYHNDEQTIRYKFQIDDIKSTASFMIENMSNQINNTAMADF